jgi:hypothetical protein
MLPHVKPERMQNVREELRKYWWLTRRASQWQCALKYIEGLTRYIATAIVSKHRLFVWKDCVLFFQITQSVVIARSDDTTFGILHSRFHELWSLRLGTSLEDRPRYTPPPASKPSPSQPASPRATPPQGHRAGLAAVHGRRDRRRQHRRRRPPPQRTARSLAQPGRVGRLGDHPGRGKSRLPETPGRQARP